MINKTINLSEINFERIDVSKEFLESIRQRGIAIPVHVRKEAKNYSCVDGRKRLSASELLSKSDDRFKKVPVMITNDFSKAGSSFWGNTQNKH